MAEQYDLTTGNYQTKPGTNRFRVGKLQIDWIDEKGNPSWFWQAEFIGDNGIRIVAGARGTQAETDIKAFNTMNFSTTSMHKRLIQLAKARGYIPDGAVSGTPDI